VIFTEFTAKPIRKNTPASMLLNKNTSAIPRMLSGKINIGLKWLAEGAISFEIGTLRADREGAASKNSQVSKINGMVRQGRYHCCNMVLNACVINTDKHELNFMQKAVCILSGLYGILRPLDLIQPYRLSMNVRLENPKGINLYHFWHETLTDYLNKTETDTIIDLAFDNYFKVIDQEKLQARVIKPVFLDEKAGKYMNVNAYAKEAMGLMTRFIVQNKLDSAKMLHEFNERGYQFMANESSDHELVFKRSEKTAQQYQH